MHLSAMADGNQTTMTEFILLGHPLCAVSVALPDDPGEGHRNDPVNPD